ncbi:MAG: protoporphyrinogen oxidase [Ignavibacteriae bacterium]|nr:protoporphyrinogen oxidase [Ignavibacteriota bacterium]
MVEVHTSHIQYPKSVLIVGAGISGLCVAYWLRQKGINVTVLEKESEVGGTMKTIHDPTGRHWLIETGPNSALETTPLFQQLFDELGITAERIYANPIANKRYILKNGVLHPLPSGPGSFISSKLWTWKGKLRLLKEPFIGRSNKEESVAEFVERRLGREFLDYAVNPFVAGVFAGNPEQLSVQAAFPKLYALEEKYGGLVKGMVKGRKERQHRQQKAKDRANMFSFIEGMQTFPKALAEHLGTHVKLDCTVEQIIPMRAGKYPIYTIYYMLNNIRQQLEANAVVLATPAYVTASIIRPIDPEMAKTLESIYYPPVAEVFLGFRKEQIRRELDGFGFLVPEKEKRKILGTIWSSAIFPSRAPKDCVALTSFVGGARNPELMTNDNEQMTNIVLSELQSIIGIEGKPVFTRVIRWKKAIPQYNLGYHKILKAIDMFEQNFRGAFLCANYRGGISVGDCVVSGKKSVNSIVTYLMSV